MRNRQDQKEGGLLLIIQTSEIETIDEISWRMNHPKDVSSEYEGKKNIGVLFTDFIISWC